jgi:hypothetical protein
MIGITHEGVRAVRELTEPESVDGVKIYAGPGTSSRESDAAVLIEVAEGPGVEDVVLEVEDVHIFLDSETLRALDDKVLDADLSGDEPHFAVLQQA